MLPRQKLSRLLLKTAAATAVALSAISAQALEVTGGFTGWWAQPDQQNHGLIIAISRLPSGEKTGVVYWAHFDEEGNPAWLIAQGDIEDATIDADVFAFEGVTFMQGAEAGANFGEQIGTMEVTFSDCLNGEVEFDTETVGAGAFAIERLTNQPGAECSGGISDDMGPGDLPQSFDIDLASTGVIEGAGGSAGFELNPGRGDFEVEIENVPAGEYEIRVGDEVRGTITVEEGEGEGEGEIEFRSPVTPGKQLLDFDPRDQIIDVVFDGEVVLTALAPEAGDFAGNGPPPFDTPAIGRLEIEVDLVNADVYPDGSASAEFEMSGPNVDFEVEVENIPAGSYALFVGGIKRGDIVVTEDEDGETEGELEFRFPPTGDNEFFDFDPRGQTIEIVEGSTLLFSADFPDERAGGGDEDDGRGGPPDDAGPPDDRGQSGEGGSVTEIEIALENSGEFPEASAEAEFESRAMRAEFEIEIENAPVGSYALLVGGVERGLIDVVADEDGETEGEIEFTDPAETEDLPLDFDPRGQTIEILDGSTTIFSGTFPE